jgi:gliding motility-associated-like protein
LFNPLTVSPPTVLNPYTLQFTDGGANPSQRSFSYRVLTNDSCGNQHFSDTATALYLNVKEKTGNRADIQWRGFAVDNADFQNFRLEKFVGDDTTTLGIFNRTDNSFQLDDLFDYSVDTLEDICFRVTAEFYNLNDAAPQQELKSYSNIVCLAPKPKFFIPNAFAPEGFNKTIKPFLLLAIDEGYQFMIFDRWHQTVFKTADRNEAWDGTYKGSPAPFDGYLFYVEYQGKDGQTYQQTGTIMLIR